MATPYQYYLQPGKPVDAGHGTLTGLRQALATSLYHSDVEEAQRQEQANWKAEFDALETYRDEQNVLSQQRNRIALLAALNAGTRGAGSGSRRTSTSPGLVNLGVGDEASALTSKFVEPHVDRLADRTRKHLYGDFHLLPSEVDFEVARTRQSLLEEFRRLGKGENEIRVLMDNAFDQYWNSKRGAPTGLNPFGGPWGRWNAKQALSESQSEGQQYERLRRIFMGYPPSTGADQDSVRMDVLEAMGTADARQQGNWYDFLGRGVKPPQFDIDPDELPPPMRSTLDDARRARDQQREQIRASILNPEDVSNAISYKNTMPPPNDGPQPPLLTDEEFNALMALPLEQVNSALLRLPIATQMEFQRRKLMIELMGQLF